MSRGIQCSSCTYGENLKLSGDGNAQTGFEALNRGGAMLADKAGTLRDSSIAAVRVPFLRKPTTRAVLHKDSAFACWLVVRFRARFT